MRRAGGSLEKLKAELLAFEQIIGQYESEDIKITKLTNKSQSSITVFKTDSSGRIGFFKIIQGNESLSTQISLRELGINTDQLFFKQGDKTLCFNNNPEVRKVLGNSRSIELIVDENFRILGS